MRRYEFQDPKDRSPNAPGVLASSTRIKALFNQNHDRSEHCVNVSEKVRTWFASASKEQGWDEVEWVGNEALLRKNFPNSP